MTTITRYARRKGPRSKVEIERERREHRERVCREIDALHADYCERLDRRGSEPIGAAYARFSTRFQDSIADQVRSILEHALRLGIYIPRKLIYFDMAARGVKKNRAGLQQLEASLAAKQAQVVMFFSTSRLFRKQYRTLEFVDRIHKGQGVRCIFCKSGIDTDDKQRWEAILAVNAMVDQFVVSMNVVNIQSAHEGLLEKQLVHGAIPFGYIAVPIEGEKTRLGRPRCKIEIDPETAPVVKMIYDWFVHDRCGLTEIARRLNSNPEIPLPPLATSGEWTKLTVRLVLSSSRYRGLWQYGESESIYLPEKDYSRKTKRAEPLKATDLPELRIVSDELWYGAQTRLFQNEGNGGRREKTADRVRRPKSLKGLLYCPEHDRPLQVFGTQAHYLQCPSCDRSPVDQRFLFSSVNRRVANQLICQKIAELLRGDSNLIRMTEHACFAQVESAQRGDPRELKHLKSQDAKLTRQIEITRLTAGESEEDRNEATGLIKELQAERASVRAGIAQLEFAMQSAPKMPTNAEIAESIASMAHLFIAAATGGNDRDAEAVRRIIETVTGGRIDVYQMGARQKNQGWLQARFTVRILPYLVTELTGAPAGDISQGVSIELELKRPRACAAIAEKARSLADKGLFNWQIAKEIGCTPSYVTNLLKFSAAQRGEQYQDGRSRRAQLGKRQVDPLKPETFALQVVQRISTGESLKAICGELGISWDTGKAAIEVWFTAHNLPAPDLRRMTQTDREELRKLLDEESSA